jgi:glycosyltransferase involved in cell wall biosynthesis
VAFEWTDQTWGNLYRRGGIEAKLRVSSSVIENRYATILRLNGEYALKKSEDQCKLIANLLSRSLGSEFLMSGKRSILLIADAFYPREIPPECKTNTYLARTLAKRGWNVFVWAGHGARVPSSSGNITVVRSTRFWGLAEAIRIFFWLALNRPKQIILMYHSLLYSKRPDINLVPLMARLAGIRSVTLFTNGEKPARGMYQERLLSFLGYEALLKYLIGPLGASDKMVFYCDDNRNRLLGRDPLDLKARCQITTPPNTLPANHRTDKSIVRASLGLTDQDFIVGYFGLLYSGKGIEYLIEAMRILKDKDPAARLVVVGPHGGVTADESWNSHCRNYEKNLRKKADDLALTDTIIWSGFCEDSKAVEILASCDSACLPFDEGVTSQRSSFITCAQIGLPVITTLTAATDAFLRDANSGIIYVEPRNAAQIADRIAQLHQDRQMTRRLGSVVKSFAAKHYSNELFVDCFDMS